MAGVHVSFGLCACPSYPSRLMSQRKGTRCWKKIRLVEPQTSGWRGPQHCQHEEHGKNKAHGKYDESCGLVRGAYQPRTSNERDGNNSSHRSCSLWHGPRSVCPVNNDVCPDYEVYPVS